MKSECVGVRIEFSEQEAKKILQELDHLHFKSSEYSMTIRLLDLLTRARTTTVKIS